jgi:hypothetical protein
MGHRIDVARDFSYICNRHARHLVDFVGQQIIESGLSALDLGGQHRLFADERIKEEIDFGHGGRGAVQATE